MERFWRRLREGRERGLRGCEGPGFGSPSVWLGSAISNTVGGRDLLSKAAASGRAASTSSHVSGRAARAAAGTASLASVVQPPLPLYRDQSIDA